MKLIDAYPFLKKHKGKLLGQLLTEYKTKYPAYSGEVKINKGGVGQFLEKLIGLENNSRNQDFSDGELKTNKVNQEGRAKETMFISQISSNFDSLIDENFEFQDSWIYEKVKNLLYVPVCKVSRNPEDWFFHSAFHIQLDHNNKALFEQLNRDILCIRKKLKTDIENSKDKFIHTSSGKYIQIRSKDSMNRPGFTRHFLAS